MSTNRNLSQPLGRARQALVSVDVKSLNAHHYLTRRFLPVLPTCDAVQSLRRSRSRKCPQVVFIAELHPSAARLSPLQLRAILAQVHSLTLRRSA